jgi:hypothetical protein
MPTYCGTIVLHEFGHYLMATTLGVEVIGAKLTCELNDNSNIVVGSNEPSNLIALGSMLSLIILMPLLMVLFKAKDNWVYFILFLFYAFLVTLIFLLMEGDFDRIGLSWLNRLLAVVIALIGLIPFYVKLWKGEIKIKKYLFV